MPKSLPAITIRELSKPTDWQSLFTLIKQLNKDITQKEFSVLLKEMRQRNYRCVGAFANDQLIGTMGFWVSFRFWSRKYIDIDNVVVDKRHRSRGIGAKMLAWVEKEGKKQNCKMAVLDSYTTAHNAHRFYFREGYVILGYHFIKHL